MARSTTESADSGKSVYATFVPGLGLPNHRRVISKKDVKTALDLEIDKDVVWEKENRHRVNVTNAPEAFVEMLRNDPDFQVTEDE